MGTKELMPHEIDTMNAIETQKPIAINPATTVVYKRIRHQGGPTPLTVIGLGGIWALSPAWITVLDGSFLTPFIAGALGLATITSVMRDLSMVYVDGKKTKLKWKIPFSKNQDAIIYQSPAYGVIVNEDCLGEQGQIVSGKPEFTTIDENSYKTPTYVCQDTLFRQDGKYFMANKFTEEPLMLWEKTLSSAVQLEQVQGFLTKYDINGVKKDEPRKAFSARKQYY